MNENIPLQATKDRQGQIAEACPPPPRTLCECMPGQINLLFISLHSKWQKQQHWIIPHKTLDGQNLYLPFAFK